MTDLFSPISAGNPSTRGRRGGATNVGNRPSSGQSPQVNRTPTAPQQQNRAQFSQNQQRQGHASKRKFSEDDDVESE